MKKLLSASLCSAALLAVESALGAGGLTALSADVSKAHQLVARRAAAEAMVLVHNRGGALPVARGSRVALFGAWKDYRTGGNGSSKVNPSRTVGFVDGLAEAGLVVDAASRETAVFVIYRHFSENWDVKPFWYRLTDDERRELQAVRAQGFRRVVLVVNGGLLPNVKPEIDAGEIDAVLFTWYPGQEGCAAIGDILVGAANPSGRLADTTVSDLSLFPSHASFMESSDYVPYEEDIFVGYRYFETVGAVRDEVVFPFGHGLSYTTFELAPSGFSADGARVSVDVKVTNTGRAAGRRSVLVYTSQRGGLGEHPALELRAFAKTGLLEPGASETLSIAFDRADLASFDDEGWSGRLGSWVLDRGDYAVLAGGSVRDVKEVGSFRVPEVEVLSSPGVKCDPARLARRLRASGKADEANVRYVGKKGIEWKDLEKDYPKEGVAKHMLKDVAEGRVTMDAFLDQMTLAELLQLTHGHPAVEKGGTGSIGLLEKYGLVGAQTCDGPCGVRRQMPSTAFPCAALIACAFDTNLTYEIGRVIGEEAADVGFDVLLAPGLCIHRHPLCGRNFEYFSEDPLVSGANAAAYVGGVQSTGVGATLKHFACNNRETNRRLASAVVSERALREIYLRGFERAVRTARPWAIMTSYNQINGLNSSTSSGLLVGILRDEWGFDGVTMTDWFTLQPMWREINAGNDVKMSHDLDLFSERSTWRRGVGERNAQEAYLAEHAAFGYLYRDRLRASAARVCRLVMKCRRFRRSAGAAK